jgi:hypothetical protein
MADLEAFDFHRAGNTPFPRQACPTCAGLLAYPGPSGTQVPELTQLYPFPSIDNESSLAQEGFLAH